MELVHQDVLLNCVQDAHHQVGVCQKASVEAVCNVPQWVLTFREAQVGVRGLSGGIWLVSQLGHSPKTQLGVFPWSPVGDDRHPVGCSGEFSGWSPGGGQQKTSQEEHKVL